MNEHEPKYPEIEVQLTGRDGNAFAILTAVRRELQRGPGEEAAREFKEEAVAEDYSHLLVTYERWVTVL